MSPATHAAGNGVRTWFAASIMWLATAGSWAFPATAQAGLPDTIERVRPSVVAVGTFQRTRSPAYQFRGTGFAIGDGSLIATNAHVLPDAVRSDLREMIVVLAMAPGSSGTRVIEARPIATDKEHDVALLRIVGTSLPALTLGDSASVRAGEPMAFTGFPIGNVLGIVPVTHRGIIAAVTPIAMPGASTRQLDDRVVKRIQAGAFEVFQLDATAYPGNSGSPLYDPETGVVLATINMVLVKATKEAALSQPTGISFAVPARYLHDLLARVQSEPAK